MHHQLMECRRCGVLFSSPIPNAAEIGKAYAEASFESHSEARFAAMTYASILPRIMRRLPDLNGAVDVGTGTGVFLLQMLQRGFQNIIGFEPSHAPVAAAETAVRRMIREEPFSRHALASNSVSLVTCHQTIEHLLDPREFCADALSILKPGGALYLVMHNRRSLSALIMGKKSPIFDIEHLQLFCRRSIGRLLEDIGFRDINFATVFNTYPLYYWLRLSPLPQTIKDPIVNWFRSGPLANITLKCPAGNFAAVAYKK